MFAAQPRKMSVTKLDVKLPAASCISGYMHGFAERHLLGNVAEPRIESVYGRRRVHKRTRLSRLQKHSKRQPTLVS